jgi:hypothetical protein
MTQQHDAPEGGTLPTSRVDAGWLRCRIVNADPNNSSHVMVNVADSTYEGTVVSVHRDCIRRDMVTADRLALAPPAPSGLVDAVRTYREAEQGFDEGRVSPHQLAQARSTLDATLSGQQGEAVPAGDLPGVEVERLTRERDEARADAERAEAERDELRDAPWPKWATECLKIIRKHSGYDGYDDAAEGVDLPSELEETLGEYRQHARRREVAARVERETQSHRDAAMHAKKQVEQLRAELVAEKTRARLAEQPAPAGGLRPGLEAAIKIVMDEMETVSSLSPSYERLQAILVGLRGELRRTKFHD